VAAERGFEETLWEATVRLGGTLWTAAGPDFKHDIADYIKYLTQRAGRLPINIVLNKRADAAAVQNFGADHVIIATGSRMEPLSFNGKVADNVLTAIQVFNGMEPKGKHVLVMGGGIMGTETALYLARQGKQVTITTRREAEELAQELYDHNNRDMLLRMVKGEDITVLSKAVPVKLEEDGVVIDQEGTEKKIAVDSMVYAGPLTSQKELYESLESTENVTCIGDCVAPGRIMDAVWGGFNAAREI